MEKLEFPLAAKISLDNCDEVIASEKTIWGLMDLYRSLIVKQPSPILVGETQSRITDFTRKYCLSQGMCTGLKNLTEKGYFENEREVLDVLVGDFKEIRNDELLKLDGVLVIGFVGLIQSGKSTCGRIIREEYNARHYPFIDGLYAFAYALGKDPTQLNRAGLREVNDLIKPNLGYDRFAKSVLHQARRQQKFNTTSVIGCDGFRSKLEGNLIQNQPQGILVGVEANIEERFRRALLKPEIAQRPNSFEDFKANSDFEYEHMMKPVFDLIKEPFLDNNLPDKGVSLRTQIKARFDSIAAMSHSLNPN